MKANFETGLKICSHCRRELSLDHFNKCKSCSDGLEAQCKDCKKEYTKLYLKSENRKKSDKLYYQNHKEVILERGRENKERRSLYDKDYYEKNKEKRILQSNLYLKSDQGRLKRSINSRRRRKEDLNFKLAHLLRNGLRTRLNGSKKNSTFDLIGCSLDELKVHLEQQFEPGMTWENYGGKDGWQIDHIIPISYFDLTKEENQRICLNYRNLQPLWAKENDSKGAKVPNNVEELVEFLKQEINNDNN